MGDYVPPVEYRSSIERGGIVVNVLVSIPGDRWRPDNDELAERVGIDTMRLVRAVEASAAPVAGYENREIRPS